MNIVSHNPNLPDESSIDPSEESMTPSHPQFSEKTIGYLTAIKDLLEKTRGRIHVKSIAEQAVFKIPENEREAFVHEVVRIASEVAGRNVNTD